MSSTISKTRRRQCIPIIYTKGTHYEVGFDVGRAFGALIKNLLQQLVPLNEYYLPMYNTPVGREAYDSTLNTVKESFPQYVRELEGIADGAQVEFHKLFLLHIIEVLPANIALLNYINEPIGCSTICVNNPECQILGHNEDGPSEFLNHWYIVSAHIVSEEPQGRHGITEERFTSMCYAGLLPGFAMSYNHHGLVFTINTASARQLHAFKMPRNFLLRALLAAENFEQAQTILLDNGCGAADGCSVNMTFLKQEGDRLFHNVEIGPTEEGKSQSQLSVLTAGPGEYYIHCNTYLRLKIPSMEGFRLDSTTERTKALSAFPPPRSKADVLQMLGDTSGKIHFVFQENGDEETSKTIVVGVFDCLRRTWELYNDNPKTTEPLVSLPLVLKEAGSLAPVPAASESSMDAQSTSASVAPPICNACN